MPDADTTARGKVVVVADARVVVDETIGRPHERVAGIQSDLDPVEARTWHDAEHWRVLAARDR